MPDRLSAVFLDRDGVINRKADEGRYITSWREFEFLPGALEGLRLLAQSRLALAVVTNQRGIARGVMTEADLFDVHARMLSTITAAGGRLDAIYHCPHEGGCGCRKPATGMFERARDEMGVPLGTAAVIGDSESDMQAAASIGALRVRIGPGGGAVDYRCPDLVSAARWLLYGE